MLLGGQWFRDAKVAHDWGKNIIKLQGNGTIKTITMTKDLGSIVKKLKVSLCLDYQNGIIKWSTKNSSWRQGVSSNLLSPKIKSNRNR
jgi:hypothetical protein